MRLRYFDAKPHVEDESIRAMVRAALPYPHDEVLERILHRYVADDDLKLIAALDEHEALQGIIGYRLDGATAATILHLRIDSEINAVPIGGALIRKVIALDGLHSLRARCARPLLALYESLGFSSRIVGEKPPGTAWYGVDWRRPIDPGAGG